MGASGFREKTSPCFHSRRVASNPSVGQPALTWQTPPATKLLEQQAGDTEGTGKVWQQLNEYGSKGELPSKQLGSDAPAPEHT